MNNNLMNHNSHKTVPANPPLSQTSRTFQVLDALLTHTDTTCQIFLIIYQMKFFTKYLRTRICLCFSFDSCSSTSEYNTSNSSQKQESTQAENLLQIAVSEKQNPFQDFFYLITRAIQMVYFSTLANCKYLKYIRKVFNFIQLYLLEINFLRFIKNIYKAIRNIIL